MMEKKEVRIDLFKLIEPHRDNTPRKLVMASGKDLKAELSKYIKRLENNDLSRWKLCQYFMSKLKISSANAQRMVYLRREWYPLVFIQELLSLTNNGKDRFLIQNKIQFLKMNQPPEVKVFAVKKLTDSLCKIIGAHAADGTINDNYFAITDGHESNIIAFNSWIEETFDLSYKIKKSENKKEFGIKFHNVIFTKYLRLIFGFPNGRKTYNFSEPEIFRKAPYNFKKAYALGVLTFEAGISIRNNVEFSVTNKHFRDSIYQILYASGISPYRSMTITSRKEDKNLWRLWDSKTKENIDIWLNFFEPNTAKWFKLYEIANGFQGKIGSIQDAVVVLNEVYPKKSRLFSLNEILRIIIKKKETFRYEIIDIIKISKKINNNVGGKWGHSVAPYLNILKSANIIYVKKKKFGKKKSWGTTIRDTYFINPNIEEWTVPYRPWLGEKVSYTKNP